MVQLISSSKILKSTESFKSRNFVFALIDNFSLLSFAGAVDALRIANRVAPHSYTWSITSETGNAVSCSANISYNVDNSFLELGRDDTIILCGGVDIQVATTKRLLNWLRREARKGVKMVALCTASYSLAKAGLLNGKKATIHWENQDSFSEEFEEIELTKTVFVVDGNRMTTAGGTSSIDLMLQLIANDLGEEKANYVADQLIYSSIRTNEDQQRLSIPTRIGVRHPKLSRVIQTMEIINLSGRVVVTKHFGQAYSQISLDISNLATGIYVAKMTGETATGTTTFVKR